MQRRNVLLPEPDGPIRHVTSPRATVRSTPLQHLDAGVGLVDARSLRPSARSRRRSDLHAALRAVLRGDAAQVAPQSLHRRRRRRAQRAASEVALEVELADREHRRHDEVPETGQQSIGMIS